MLAASIPRPPAESGDGSRRGGSLGQVERNARTAQGGRDGGGAEASQTHEIIPGQLQGKSQIF